MAFRVVITPEAQAAIDRDIAHIRLHTTPEIADRWYRGLFEAIRSLSNMPRRCASIPEQGHFDRELRQLLYGRRQHARRVIFHIDRDTVHVVRYQHGALPPLDGSAGGALTS